MSHPAPSEILYHQITEAMEESGWTQSDLAEAIGTSQPNVSAILRGKVNPGWATVCLIADALEMTITTNPATRPPGHT